MEDKDSAAEDAADGDAMVTIDPESGAVMKAPESTKVSIQTYNLIVATAKFGLIMIYFYICDRYVALSFLDVCYWNILGTARVLIKAPSN